jgi:WD40 repeat protein
MMYDNKSFFFKVWYGMNSGKILVWNETTIKTTLSPSITAMTALKWLNDDRLASAGSDLKIRFWNIFNQSLVKTITGAHTGHIQALALLTNGFLVSGSGSPDYAIAASSATVTTAPSIESTSSTTLTSTAFVHSSSYTQLMSSLHHSLSSLEAFTLNKSTLSNILAQNSYTTLYSIDLALSVNITALLATLPSGQFSLSSLSPAAMAVLLNSKLDLSDCIVNCSN